MGRLLLVWRLGARDLRRRRGEAVMLLLAIMAATTTLTLGLILHGVTIQPYHATRAATVGPDVVAAGTIVQHQSAKHYGATARRGVSTPADLAALQALTQASGVTSHSGPYPVTTAIVRFHGHMAGAEVEGRDRAPASVDQPRVTQGSWIRNNRVVVERSFADALGVHVGDAITLSGRTFVVAVAAVTAAVPSYPEICGVGCNLDYPELTSKNTGLMWLTRADAQSLATPMAPLSYFLNLKLADPASAQKFARVYSQQSDEHGTIPDRLADHQPEGCNAGQG